MIGDWWFVLGQAMALWLVVSWLRRIHTEIRSNTSQARDKLRRAEALMDPYQHDEDHFNGEGGCQCECPHCVGDWWIPGGPVLGEFRGRWFWRRSCICPGCSQECPKIGRLERDGPAGAQHPPPPNYLTGSGDDSPEERKT